MSLSRVYNSDKERQAEKVLKEMLLIIKQEQDLALLRLEEDYCYKNGPLAGPTQEQIDTIPGLKEAWERVIILQQLGK